MIMRVYRELKILYTANKKYWRGTNVSSRFKTITKEI